MLYLTAIYHFIVNHGTKVLGFVQVTIGVLAGATDFFTPAQLKAFILINGLLVAWRGYFNSKTFTT